MINAHHSQRTASILPKATVHPVKVEWCAIGRMRDIGGVEYSIPQNIKTGDKP